MRSLSISLILGLLASSSHAGICQAGRVRQQKVVVQRQIVQEIVPAAINNVFYSAGAGAQQYAAGYLSRRDDALLAQYDRELDRYIEGMKQLLASRAELLGQQPQAIYGVPFVPVDPRALQQQQSYGGYGQQRQQPQQSCPGAGQRQGGPPSTMSPGGAGPDTYRRPDAPAAPHGAFSQQAPRQSVANARCAECHSGAEPKAGLDVTRPLTFDQRKAALRQALSGEMPKDREPLSPQELGGLAAELFQNASPDQLRTMVQALNGEP